jgi:hypothetical protein
MEKSLWHPEVVAARHIKIGFKVLPTSALDCKIFALFAGHPGVELILQRVGISTKADISQRTSRLRVEVSVWGRSLRRGSPRPAGRFPFTTPLRFIREGIEVIIASCRSIMTSFSVRSGDLSPA